jgi:hypothetical protein
VNPDSRISKAIKTIALWSNRANDAWAMGEADWVYDPERGNVLTSMASKFINQAPDDPEAWETAADFVKGFAQFRGIDLKRHRWRPTH